MCKQVSYRIVSFSTSLYITDEQNLAINVLVRGIVNYILDFQKSNRLDMPASAGKATSTQVTTEKAVNFLQWQRYSGPNGCLRCHVSAELVVQNAVLRFHSAQSLEEVVSRWKLATGTL